MLQGQTRIRLHARRRYVLALRVCHWKLTASQLTAAPCCSTHSSYPRPGHAWDKHTATVERTARDQDGRVLASSLTTGKDGPEDHSEDPSPQTHPPMLRTKGAPGLEGTAADAAACANTARVERGERVARVGIRGLRLASAGRPDALSCQGLISSCDGIGNGCPR